jgi:hypothetical protein
VRVRNLDAAEIQHRLDLPDETTAWLGRLERPAGSHRPVLPDEREAAQLLERLGVQPADRAETLAARPDPATHPELWWVLDRAYHAQLAEMGHLPPEGFPGWPGMPTSTGALGRHLYVWVFLATLPDVRRYHADRGIPDEISWASLAFLGRAMTGQRRVFGKSGLYGEWSLPLIFRGASYYLGRLMFDRGAGGLNVHIPEGGPLDPAACEESFDRARAFFPRHFPEEPVTAFRCHSWLLDDQLTAYLPEDSNIVRFQRRFRLLPYDPDADQPPGDRAILEFVFHRVHDGPELPTDLIEHLPQDTALQRAFVAHLRAGGHWHTRTGWFPF